MSRLNVSRLTKIAVFGLCILPTAVLHANPGRAEASAVDVGINVLLLIAGLLCFATCTRVFGLLKGGELSPGWQMLSVSFLVFSIAQFLNLANELEFFALPHSAVSTLQVVALFLIFLGVAKIKKSLT